MKKLWKTLGILCLLCALIGAFVFYSTTISVANVNIVHQKITSEKITQELNLKIAFISDIHYNHFMDKERLEHMINKINDNQPDMILFAGDLFDEPSLYPVSDQAKEELIALLKSLHADLGKFAVLGEQDHDPAVEDMIEELLFEADFELLNNEHILFSKDGSNPIHLVGIDSLVGGNPDIAQAFENVDTNAFTIVITHAPDLVSELPLSGVDLVLAGHSHGGKIPLPFIGDFQTKQGALHYTSGEYTLNNHTRLIISNGLGTTGSDIRIFADPQCHILRLTQP